MGLGIAKTDDSLRAWITKSSKMFASLMIPKEPCGHMSYRRCSTRWAGIARRPAEAYPNCYHFC